MSSKTTTSDSSAESSERETAPFPREDNEKDYKTAISRMDLNRASRRNPIYISTGGDTLAVVGTDVERGDAVLTDPNNPATDETWPVEMEALWKDWTRGKLGIRQMVFHASDEGTYNTEEETSVSTTVLETLVERSTQRLLEKGSQTGEVDQPLAQSLTKVRAALNDQNQ